MARTSVGQVTFDEAALRAFCERWGIVELAIFGSALRDDFRPDSDIDLLVTFARDTRATLFDLDTIESELAALLGRPVDLVSRPGIERSKNEFRREAILGSARVVYAAA
jgi:predicted nucleotidyltransferase